MPESKRRLAAIMFTDISDYTSLTQKSETQALQTLAKLNQSIQPIFRKHDGQVIKTLGDGFLVEFPSAMDAVLSGIELQESMHRHAPEHQAVQMHLKIGVHIGDVFREGGDIFGDTVNVASRIEPLAGPGGICISQQVFDLVKNKLSYAIVGMGPQNLKNVSEPVETYRIILPWRNEFPETSRPSARDKHRLVVLPLNSFSPDPKDEYLADGMTEEIITRLSGIQGLRVIARTSAMKYKGIRKSILEIGSELNVGSALEGSIRKSGDRLRITLQLVDTSTEEHLWANSYDRNLADIFAVQTDIAENVAQSLEVKLLKNDLETIRKLGTKSLVAYTSYMRGRELMSRYSKESMQEAKRQFEIAINDDPSFARAYAGLADWTMTWGGESTVENCKKARPLVIKALDLDRNSAEAHASMAQLLKLQDYDWKGAEQELKRALDINSGYATAHQRYASVLANLGKFDEMIKEIETAVELDPLSASLAYTAGYMYSLTGEYSETLSWWEQALKLSPDFEWVKQILSYPLVELGRTEEAMAKAKALAQNEPNNPTVIAMLAYVLARTGQNDEALPLLKHLEELKRQSKAVASDLWYPYRAAGDLDRAFELVQEALETREIDPSWLRSPSHFKKLQSDPRYHELLRKYNMESP